MTRALVLAALAMAAAAPLARAQSAVVTGTVLRPTVDDSVPAAGVRVVLHRVGAAAQGPIDSVSSGRDGRFTFRFTVDTSALYLVSASMGGIEYFSQPLRPGDGVEELTVVVSDTSSTARVRLAARHLVIARPESDGTRDALDLLVLENPGILTRVAADSTAATWSMPLPRGALEVIAGEGDFSPDAVTQQGDSLLLGAPVAPGQKQLLIQYHLPASATRVEVPFADSVGTVDVLVEERATRVAGGTLVPVDSQIIEGRTFRRWSGTVPAGGSVVLAFPGAATLPRWVLPLLVGVMGATLLLAAWRLRGRRAPAPATVPSRARADELVDAIARLDARYADREGAVAPEEWAAYRAERSRLRDELEAALRGGEGSAG